MVMQQDRKIVVLTPVKNEAWILPLFCKSASIWADYIIIADQNSTDGSREIASQFPKVVVIDNDSSDLDEGYRDGLLINKARELVGNNGILFRIDADEIFTPNFDSEDWLKIKSAKDGTVFMFRWVQMYRKLSSCWETKGQIIYGAFVDDGREYSPKGLIHARSMFNSKTKEDTIVLQDIALLHFQFADWKRMCSKHIWYQCFERIKFPQKSAIDIYRMYHWMYNPSLPYEKVPIEWISVYRDKYYIDIHSYNVEKKYWWDDKTKEYFQQYSPQYFRHIETYYTIGELVRVPGKNILDKLLMLYLHCTRGIYNVKQGIAYRIVNEIDNILKYRMGI